MPAIAGLRVTKGLSGQQDPQTKFFPYCPLGK
jgi:hypothetical protein